MKSLLIAVTIALSTSAFASTPATTAVTSLLAAGEYYGTNEVEKCSVKILANNNSVAVFVSTKKSSAGFTIVDSATNYNVNEVTGEVFATEKLKSPHYLQGAVKVLTIVTTDDDEVKFYISTIAINHRGDDMSSYVTCNISK
jgi:hypothetical protein